jgi:zinc protease
MTKTTGAQTTGPHTTEPRTAEHTKQSTNQRSTSQRRARLTVVGFAGGIGVVIIVMAALLAIPHVRSVAKSTSEFPQLAIEQYSLANGLQVVLHEDRTTPKAAVTFLVRTGSKDEPDRRSGFAHLFEHLMFMGTKRVPQGQYDKIIESYGGENNAYTAADMTVYYSNAQAKALPTLLWLEADRLNALGDNIDQKKLDLQRDVVLNERKQTTQDSPYGEADEAINQLIYPSTHPYHRGTIGSPTDLNAATVQDVKDFFAANYVPNNITLVVAGNFDKKSTKELIGKLFSPLTRKNDVLRKDLPNEQPLGLRRASFVDQVTNPRISFVWRIPSQTQQSFDDVDLAAQVLQARLGRVLIDEGLAISVSAGASGGLLDSTLTVAAIPTDKTTLAKLEARLLKELHDFRKGVSSGELKAAITSTEAKTLNNTQDIVSRSLNIATDAFYFNDPNHTLAALKQRSATKTKNVNFAIKQWIDLENVLTLTVVPARAQQSADALANRPADLQPSKATFPKSTSFRLRNGINVTYWQSGQFATTYLQLVAAQGGGTENIKGTTSLLTMLLDKGSKTKDFFQATDRLGATVSAAASATQSIMSLNTLSRNLEPATRLFREALTTPLITDQEFKSERSVLAESLDSRPDDPRSLSLDAATATYYGPSNQYGEILTGTEVRKIKREDVQKRRSELFYPANVTMFVAGDKDATEVKKILDRTLGSWNEPGAKKAKAIAPKPPLNTSRLLFIDSPDAAQTMIRIFTPAIAVHDPKALEYDVLGTILGGTFTSRLNNNLREDKGYTYGANAGLVFDEKFGYLNTRTSVDSAVTGKAIQEIKNEFDDIEKGVTQEEVVKASQTQAAGIVDVFASPQSIVETHASLFEIGETQKDLESDYARLLTMRTSDVSAVAKGSVDLRHAVWVIIGDRKTVLPQLTDLGLPKVEFFKVPK